LTRFVAQFVTAIKMMRRGLVFQAALRLILAGCLCDTAWGGRALMDLTGTVDGQVLYDGLATDIPLANIISSSSTDTSATPQAPAPAPATTGVDVMASDSEVDEAPSIAPTKAPLVSASLATAGYKYRIGIGTVTETQPAIPPPTQPFATGRRDACCPCCFSPSVWHIPPFLVC
jgi:hypothetical protein